MKADYAHLGKFFQYQRQKKYQEHLQRMQRISHKRNSLFRQLNAKNTSGYGNHIGNLQKSGSKSRSKSPLNLSSIQGPAVISGLINGFKNQQQRLQHQQNIRLMRKLSQIQRRKNHFIQQNQEQKYYTLNVKNRKVIRRIKQEQIQEENNNMVQRIVQRLSRQRSIRDINSDNNAEIAYQLQKSRSRARKQKYYNKKIPNNNNDSNNNNGNTIVYSSSNGQMNTIQNSILNEKNPQLLLNHKHIKKNKRNKSVMLPHLQTPSIIIPEIMNNNSIKYHLKQSHKNHKKKNYQRQQMDAFQKNYQHNHEGFNKQYQRYDQEMRKRDEESVIKYLNNDGNYTNTNILKRNDEQKSKNINDNPEKAKNNLDFQEENKYQQQFQKDQGNKVVNAKQMKRISLV